MDSKYLLTILIPTYNRIEFLVENLKHIESIKKTCNVFDKILISISDNNSNDDTYNIIQHYLPILDLNVAYVRQETNIGLEANAVFLISKATTPYIMYLGDDDYFSKDYLLEIISLIEDYTPSVIVGTFKEVIVSQKKVFDDLNIPNVFYDKGIDSAYKLYLVGHQLSGLVFKREGLLESYLKHPHFRNIYLFEYFVAKSALAGKSIHVRKYPLLVTVGGKRDWNYGKDWLAGEHLKGAKALFKGTPYIRFKVEKKIISLVVRPILTHKSKIKQLAGSFFSIFFSKYISTRGRVYFTLFWLKKCIYIKILEKKLMKL